MKAFILLGILLSTGAFAANRGSEGRKAAPTIFVFLKIHGIGSEEVIGIDEQTNNTYQSLYEASRSRHEIVNDVSLRFGENGEIRYCIDFQNGVQSYNFLHSLAVSIRKDIEKTGVQRTLILTGEGCHNLETATEQDISRL